MPDEVDAKRQAKVADAVDDERLLARVTRRFLADVVADQQIRTQPDALPADEHQSVGVAEHEDQHEEDEEVQIGEEPVVAPVAVHVAGGVDVDQKADAGDHQDHHCGQRVEQEAEGYVEHGRLGVQRIVAEVSDTRGDPVVEHDLDVALFGRELGEPGNCYHRENERRQDRRAGDGGDDLFALDASAEQPVDDDADQGDERDQPE